MRESTGITPDDRVQPEQRGVDHQRQPQIEPGFVLLQAVDEVVGKLGALPVGNRTFRGDDPYKGTAKEGKPFGGAWTGPTVRAHPQPPGHPGAGVTFVGDLDTGIAAALAAAGDKYVNVLGASTAQQCLEAGVLDEILVLVAPVLLGDGVRLFDRPGGTNVKLERLSLTSTPQVTNLWLRVAR